MADHSSPRDYDMKEDDLEWEYEYHETDTEVKSCRESLHEHDSSHALELLRNTRSLLCHEFLSHQEAERSERTEVSS